MSGYAYPAHYLKKIQSLQCGLEDDTLIMFGIVGFSCRVPFFSVTILGEDVAGLVELRGGVMSLSDCQVIGAVRRIFVE